jgi:drug/metabolite transporter superfamily protein YnfA
MNLVLSIVVLASIALVAGAYALWRRTGQAKQPALMLLLALIAMINVLIWTIPDAGGDAPIARIQEEAGE